MVWDVSPSGGFGAPRPGLDDRWITDEPAVVEPGELVVVPTRPFGTAVPGDWPYFGPGTSEVAATFVDPRTGEVVDEVAVGDDAGGGVHRGLRGGQPRPQPDRRQLRAGRHRPRRAVPRAGHDLHRARGRVPRPRRTAAAGRGGRLPGVDGRRLAAAPRGPGRRPRHIDRPEEPCSPSTRGAGRSPTKRRWTSCRRRSSSARTAGAWRWAGGWNTALEIRDAATLDERSTVELGSDARLTDLSWSEDGGLLLAVGEGGGLHVVDTAHVAGPARRRSPRTPHACRSSGCPTGAPWPSPAPAARSGSSTSSGRSPGAGCRRRSGTWQTPSFMVPDPTEDLVLLSDQDWVMSYPMTPSAWLRDGLRDRGP